MSRLHETPAVYPAMPPASVRATHAEAYGPWRLGQLVLLLLAVVPAVQPLLSTTGAIPLSTRLWASVLWVATLGPSWQYLVTPAERRRPIPFLPIVGLLWGLYYALPVLLDAESLNLSVWIDPRTDYQPAVNAALVGWGAVLVGFGVVRRQKGWAAFERLSPPQVQEVKWGARLLAVGLAVRFAVAVLPAAQGLGGIGVFLSSFATFGLALLVMAWRRGQMRTVFKAIAVLGFGLLSLVEMGTGSVATLGFVFITTALAYWAASPVRIGAGVWAALILGACTVLILKGVARDFRAVAWTDDVELSVVDRAQLIGGLVLTRIDEEGAVGALSGGTDATVNRSSNADLLAEIIRRTPLDVPFWNGETYLSLVGVFVPRILWPDKPVKRLGQDFGHRYGYLGEDDVVTSFNFPWLVEAYANYGMLAVVLVCLAAGMIYAALFRLINTPGQRPWVTVAGIVALTPLLNIESDFSLIFGGLPLTLVSLWAVFWWIDRTERKRLRRGIPS